MRSGGQLLVESLINLGAVKGFGVPGESLDFPAAFARALASPTGAVLDLAISAEAITPRQTLTQLRQSAFRARECA